MCAGVCGRNDRLLPAASVKSFACLDIHAREGVPTEPILLCKDIAVVRASQANFNSLVHLSRLVGGHVEGLPEMRLWRLDRILSMDLLDRRFTRRDDFNLASYAGQSFGVSGHLTRHGPVAGARPVEPEVASHGPLMERGSRTFCVASIRRGAAPGRLEKRRMCS